MGGDEEGSKTSAKKYVIKRYEKMFVHLWFIVNCCMRKMHLINTFRRSCSNRSGTGTIINRRPQDRVHVLPPGLTGETDVPLLVMRSTETRIEGDTQKLH